MDKLMRKLRDLEYSEKRKKRYRSNFVKYGPSIKSLNWKSRESQKIRFLQFVDNLNLDGQSLLDVGCGFGDLVPLLQDRFIDFSYSGADIVEEFIAIAKERYPQYKFYLIDYFANPLAKRFDYIICSGVLNGNLGDEQKTMNYRCEAIKMMFSKCRKSLAFNMAGAYPQPKNSHNSKIYYADLEIIEKLAKTLSDQYMVIDNYCRRDFTCILSHH